jgi:hypothetical protein
MCVGAFEALERELVLELVLGLVPESVQVAAALVVFVLRYQQELLLNRAPVRRQIH